MTKFIRRKYGTQKNCAEALGVDVRTIYRWANVSAMPMLKYADTIVKTCDTTRLELIGEILFFEDQKL